MNEESCSEGKKSKVLIYVANDNNVGQRIDNFLFNKLKTVPKTHIYKIIRKGELRVNKKRCKANYHLNAGDEVRIPPLVMTDVAKKLAPSQELINKLNQSIIYETDDFLIINKPSGMASHGGSGINFGVIEILRAARPGAHYLELAHRLDRETSGCLIIAKKRAFLRYIHELIRNADLTKTYIALLKGKLEEQTKKVEDALVKNVLKSGERMVRIDAEQGKKAVSIFKRKKIFDNFATLVEVQIKTGRTHQIRVHAASIGHPIAGDTKYGDENFNAAMREHGLDRMFLHAYSLKFKLRNSEQQFEIKSNIDNSLDLLLKTLGF